MTDEHNPNNTAVALKYEGPGAPRVVAKGRGLIAEQIIALAKEHHIPLREDEELVALLAQIELDAEIPASLYAAVAQVLAFAYYVSGKTLPG